MNKNMREFSKFIILLHESRNKGAKREYHNFTTCCYELAQILLSAEG